VESGLDMPSVNTLVVDRADRLGLAQLYQLRGRVGRRGQRAYAYLLHPADRVLTEEAYERLKAIGEFTDLGSGFRLAMRDLEIRGAGNLLGEAQSGHIAAVGFDLYCEMVTEAGGPSRATGRPRPVEVVIDVPLDAHLPRGYVSRDDRAHGGLPPLAAVNRPRRASTTSARSGSTGTGASAARRGAPGGGVVAGGVRPGRHHRPAVQKAGTHVACVAQGVAAGAPAAPPRRRRSCRPTAS